MIMRSISSPSPPITNTKIENNNQEEKRERVFIQFQHPVNQSHVPRSDYTENPDEDYHPPSSTLLPPHKLRGWMEYSHEKCYHYTEKVPSHHYTLHQVAEHNRRDDCWIVLHGKVYDVTSFLDQHPGGANSILVYAGKDATSLFDTIHAEDAQILKSSYVIGHLSHSTSLESRRRFPVVTPTGNPITLNPRTWTLCKLIAKEEITHDTRLFTFALPEQSRMWLPWGKHLELAIRKGDDRMVYRPYTPIQPILKEENNGTFSVVIKIYFAEESKPGGELTTALEKLRIGEDLEVRGPKGIYSYLGRSIFDIAGHYAYMKNLNFIVGGTGLTPALAIIRAILLEEKNEYNLRVSLIFANKTVEDILCKPQLESLLKENSASFQLCHVISKATPQQLSSLTILPNEKVETGIVTTKILEQYCLPLESDTIAFICGPPLFVSNAVMPALEDLGYDENHSFEL